jgi:hypothetical protein
MRAACVVGDVMMYDQNGSGLPARGKSGRVGEVRRDHRRVRQRSQRERAEIDIEKIDNDVVPRPRTGLRRCARGRP